MTASSSLAATADWSQLQHMIAQYAPVPIRVDTASLSPGDRQALIKLIDASRIVNRIFMRQLWSGNLAEYEKVRADTLLPIGRARLELFQIYKGPWSDLDEHMSFLPDVPQFKPPGANFYPEHMTREQFNIWAHSLSPEARAEAESFFTVIRYGPDGNNLHAIPYSTEYKADLAICAQDLKQAAEATGNATLKRFLDERAAAFLSNDYYASDIAWMDLDSPLDITIGPYETYDDQLFGYKASFESYVNIRDEVETAKVKFFGDHMQEVEDALPIPAQYRNKKIGLLSPIRVVNEVFAAGDHAVKTAAYNLPSDELVVQEKGSKSVMLKNIQEAKFRTTLEPIAKIVLAPSSRQSLNFDSFFTHILAHEMSHGIGPHQITVNGKATTPRQELKDIYSAIEEAKADVLGLYMLELFYERGYLKHDENGLYTTFLASSFRTMRFGLNEAHAKGMALQFNYLTDKGAFVREGGEWHVNLEKIGGAVRGLAHDLLMIEATGNYAGAKKMLDTLGIIRPDVKATLARLNKVPVDIRPIFETADEIAPSPYH